MKLTAPLFLVVALTGCAIHDQPPHAVLAPIAEEYYACPKCGSLDGGIYGKGPVAHFRSDKAAGCIHRWVRISRAEFQERARTHFPAEWVDALPFFKQPQDD